MKQIEKDPELRGLKESVQVHLTDEGLRIELLERTSSLFFDTGSAALKPRSIRLLSVIAHELARLPNPVVIEGHTDSRPLNGANGYSNWELSTDRANAARHAMEANGLTATQVIAVRGYADRKLLHPEDPTHFSNRRVSILVAYTKKGQ
jgi:chemotaxis protein MotB